MLLDIKNLKVSVDSKEILSGVNLSIKKGETHIIMGKNGSGKSSLLNTIIKNPHYSIIDGSVCFFGENLKDKSISEVARAGIFLSFQHPPSIAGLSISTLLKHSVNSVRRANGEESLSAPEFFKLSDKYCELLDISPDWLKREINVGFSGGEKKRISMLEMLFLKPKLALLDEPDSGVDVDSVNIIKKAIEYSQSAGTSFIIVSHYPQLIGLVNSDFIHIMKNGVIIKTGDKELASLVLREGFENV